MKTCQRSGWNLPSSKYIPTEFIIEVLEVLSRSMSSNLIGHKGIHEKNNNLILGWSRQANTFQSLSEHELCKLEEAL